MQDSVFLVRYNIVHGPVQPGFERMHPFRAVCFGADGAAELQAAICVYKQLNSISEPVFNQVG